MPRLSLQRTDNRLSGEKAKTTYIVVPESNAKKIKKMLKKNYLLKQKKNVFHVVKGAKDSSKDFDFYK